MSSFLIGLGGTGAKCVESFINLCAAGLAPPEVHLTLVDQDQSNGNLTRTKTLIGLYSVLQTQLRGAGNNLAPETGLLRTRLTHSQAGLVWYPAQSSGDNTLGDIYNYRVLKPELRDLMDVLYTSAEERDQQLHNGFLGRPKIGAAIFMAADASQALNHLVDDISHALGGNADSANIFLIGSIFGGTGAAGLPTLARKIDQLLQEVGLRDRVNIGGALMLPYFTYQLDLRKGDGVRPSGDQFIDQSISALHYYARLFKTRSPFDHLYVLGWNPLIQVRDLGAGSIEQKNPPLLPELYAALAACRFLTATTHPPGKVFMIGRNDQLELRWDDLPKVVINDGSGHDVKHKLGQLLRFAVAFHYIYAKFLVRNSSNQHPWLFCESEAWFRHLLEKPGVNLGNDTYQTPMENLHEFSKKYLVWIATMIHTCKDVNLEPRLFAPEIYAEPTDGEDSVLHPELSYENRKNFNRLVYDAPGRNLQQLFWELTYAKPHRDHHKLGVFVGSLYDLCAPSTVAIRN